MTINQKIIAAVKLTNVPVYPSVKAANGQVFFVFNYWSRGENFGDNTPQNEHYFIQLHLFCPDEYDSVSLREQTKRLLTANGFTYPETTDASDDDGQHWTFEFEDVTGVTDG